MARTEYSGSPTPNQQALYPTDEKDHEVIPRDNRQTGASSACCFCTNGIPSGQADEWMWLELNSGDLTNKLIAPNLPVRRKKPHGDPWDNR